MTRLPLLSGPDRTRSGPDSRGIRDRFETTGIGRADGQ